VLHTLGQHVVQDYEKVVLSRVESVASDFITTRDEAISCEVQQVFVVFITLCLGQPCKYLILTMLNALGSD
jgi:hypothetical protein